jgi:hypothetical protein
MSPSCSFRLTPVFRLAGFQWDLALAEVQRREAKEAGLALNWPSRLPNTRLAAGSFRVGASASA